MAQAAPPPRPTEPLDHAVPFSAPRSPTKARRLSPAMITAATGEESLEELEELEMIFGGVSEIGGLERCTRLHTLTLIDCGLRRISNLEPVSHSLIKLCLCDQGLKKIENLFLPGLKELYLHQNNISKIEGLHGCPSLRRLWLFSNRIAVAEGVHHCGDLRELWLHDNKIASATGLESLVHLQNLGLAGNPIVGLRYLSGLRCLPSLAELTLDDIHFGACPVVSIEGYRDFVMCFLRQVRRLDGLEVAEEDRAEADAKYEEEALAYQEKLEEIERKRIHEIRQAEKARDEGAKHGSEVKAEMMRAFQGLEGLVKEGRAAMAEQRSRQEQVRASNLRELEASLSDLKKQYAREVDKRVHAEAAKAEEEERLFAALEEQTCLERDYSQLVARQQSGFDQEGIAVQELSDHSPDFQRLRREVWANQQTQSGQQVQLMNVLRACRLYNRRLCDDFIAAAGESAPTIRLYLSLSENDVEEVCRAGLAGLTQPAVALFPDPKQAAAAAAAEAAETSTREGVEKSLQHSSNKTRDPAATSRDATAGDANASATEMGAKRTAAGARPGVAARAAVMAKTARASSRESPTSSLDRASSAGGGYGGGLKVIVQLAVVLVEEEVDAVEGVSCVREALPGRFRMPGADGRGVRSEDRRLSSPAALLDHAGVSGRVLQVKRPPQGSPSPGTGGEAGDGRQGQDRSCCYVLPARCFARALPEFHLLCASGAVGEDRRALEDALAELSADMVLGAGPATDLLSQLELKMQEEVTAYLERMKQEVTVDEAFKYQATDADMRRKAAGLASVRADVKEERALQESLLRQGPRL